MSIKFIIRTCTHFWDVFIIIMKVIYLKVQQGILELHKEQVEVEEVKDSTKDQQTTNTESSSDDEINDDIDDHDDVIDDQDGVVDDQDDKFGDQHQESEEQIQTTASVKQKKRKNLTVKGKSKKARIS